MHILKETFLTTLTHKVLQSWALAMTITGLSLKCYSHRQSCFSKPGAFVTFKQLDTQGTHFTESTGYE